VQQQEQERRRRTRAGKGDKRCDDERHFRRRASAESLALRVSKTGQGVRGSHRLQDGVAVALLPSLRCRAGPRASARARRTAAARRSCAARRVERDLCQPNADDISCQTVPRFASRNRVRPSIAGMSVEDADGRAPRERVRERVREVERDRRLADAA
jgi:hypothetical protein